MFNAKGKNAAITRAIKPAMIRKGIRVLPRDNRMAPHFLLAFFAGQASHYIHFGEHLVYMEAGGVFIGCVITPRMILLPLPREIVVGAESVAVIAPPHVAIDPSSGPQQSYHLTINGDGVRITAADAAGAFYARQTLAQIRR